MRAGRGERRPGAWSPAVGSRQAGVEAAGSRGTEQQLAGRSSSLTPRISHPGEPAERQAERVAQAVTSGAGSARHELGTARSSPAVLQRQSAGGMASSGGGAARAVGSALGGGQPLPAATRGFFERRMGHDLGSVRVHTGAGAAGAAKAVAAHAYTRGEDVVFGAGQWRPETAQGKKLLAHELTHVVQQRSDASAHGTVQREPDPTAWIQDRDGSLYYKTQEEAERRKTALEAEGKFSEYRVTSFERKGTTYWRVEMRGEKKPAAPPAPAPSPSPPPAPKPAPPAPAPAPKDKAPETKPPDQPAPQEPAPQQPTPSQPAPGEGPDAGAPPEPKPAPPASGTPPAATVPASGGTRVFSLTFDDGPHHVPLGKGTNRTEKVLDTLKTKGVKGAFFVQTGVPIRGASTAGKALMKRMQAEGHTVGIHTGGTTDHELHTTAERAGRLEGELMAAKTAINTETGETPTLVRPPTGAFNKAVSATYAKVSLTNLLWDIDGDVGASSLADLKARLDSADPKAPGIAAVAARGWTGTTPSKPKIVVLYHDIRKNTADNIGPVIDHIRAVTKKVSGGKDTADFAPP
ncbi:MAG: DUF4157 domain-containing protein [Acidobacteria bacterium]|nr:DUF4157 domain-containing protein [Acidobacteriota bacterium]